MGDWFVDWFNTPEYLSVYQHRNEQDAEEVVNLISSTLKITSGMSVLDMACGAGRHSILFAKRGCNVTAFDYSEMLLNEARKNADREKVKIDFHKEDIRNFRFDEKFDIIINLFTSFGYFDNETENNGVLLSAYKHLDDHGHFVLDFFNSEYLKRNLVHRTENIISGSLVIQERFLDRERVKKRITVKKNDHTELYYEDVRLYSFLELQNKFEDSGFKISRICGDFNGSDFDSESSPRVIIFASK